MRRGVLTVLWIAGVATPLAAQTGPATELLERCERNGIELLALLSGLPAAQWTTGRPGTARFRREDAGSGHHRMRIDGIIEGEAALIAIDDMEERHLEDTRDWTSREIVLEVPPESVTILYGVMITGDGTVRADDLALEEAPAGTEPTAETVNEVLGGLYDRPVGTLPAPLNLDFETEIGDS